MPESSPEFHPDISWASGAKVPRRVWVCGYCGNQVAEDQGYTAARPGETAMHIRACPGCKLPTVFDARPDQNWYFPIAPPGRNVANVPEQLAKLFEEARRSAGVNANTASVMVCRAMLMHIAVEKGAKERDTFESYIQFLVDRHYIPPEGKALADYIRTLGRDANHRIVLMDHEDAEAAITFTEALLRLIYELPSRIPAKVTAKAEAAELF